MADLPELIPSEDPRGSYHQPKHASAAYSLPSSSQPYSTEKEAAPPQEGIFGAKSNTRLRGRTFWGLIILAIVIIAAAVGGGVGGALAVQHAKSKSTLGSDTQPEKSGLAQVTVTVTARASTTGTAASASSSATSSSAIVPDASTLKSVDISCPEPTMVSWKGESFNCQNNLQVSPSITTDITGIVAYTLQTCIDACSTWNQLKGGGCKAVSMEWDLSYAYQVFSGANCFLRGTNSPTTDNSNVTSLILS